jgi:hypothetical protein
MQVLGRMFKKIIQKLAILVQKVIMDVSLFLIYYLILGLAVVFALLFNRKILTGGSRLQNTNWFPASGYDKDALDSKMQS